MSQIVTASIATSKGDKLSETKFLDSKLFWLVRRAKENGRFVLMSEGNCEVLETHFNVSNRVHEYGGGSYDMRRHKVVFCNAKDGAIYIKNTKDSTPQLLNEATKDKSYRFSDLSLSERFVVAVREVHSGGGTDPKNELVLIPLLKGSDIMVLASGSDFYSSPRISPDGERVVWVEWDHPNMPWNQTRLMSAEIKDGQVCNTKRVVGGEGESICEPKWSESGDLYFVSDRSGWSNIWLFDYATNKKRQLFDIKSECAPPAWVFGNSSYDFLADGEIVFTPRNGTKQSLVKYTNKGNLKEIECDFSSFSYITTDKNLRRVGFVGASSTDTSGVVVLDLSTKNTFYMSKDKTKVSSLPTSDMPVTREISYTSSGKSVAYMNLYTPQKSSEKMPLIVNCHGGPTAISESFLDYKVLFWTTRGYAYADINYRGSYGYGKEYRDALNGNWGVIDVDDCVYGAKHLIDTGVALEERVYVRGSSAGGYTALCSLAHKMQVFKKGTSIYGVSDLEKLAMSTHKFEKHYLDTLLGTNLSEGRDLYKRRSPINMLDEIKVPLLVLQGEDDKVVPPSQAESIVEKLRSKNKPCSLVMYPSEGHGFKQEQTQIDALEKELSFYEGN